MADDQPRKKKAKRPLSRRCSMCSINWHPDRYICPRCEERTWPSFTEEWNKNADAAAQATEKRSEFQPIVVEFKGLLWIPHDGLIASGQDCLESFKVVESDDGTIYELQGHVQDKTGETGGMWWVEKITVPDAPQT